MSPLIILMTVQVASPAATNYAVDAPMRAPSSAPEWADAFDGAKIDSGTWRFDTERNAQGWFTRPYQLILNLAIGGDWGGAKGVDDAALPQRMTVDYVRYWQGEAQR